MSDNKLLIYLLDLAIDFDANKSKVEYCVSELTKIAENYKVHLIRRNSNDNLLSLIREFVAKEKGYNFILPKLINNLKYRINK